MQDYQSKWQEEKKKSDNMLKMQQAFMDEIDDYQSAFHLIRVALSPETSQYDQPDDITPEQAMALAHRAAQSLGKKCQCDRWKHLYQQQSAESTRQSKEKEQLLMKVAAKEKEEEVDRVEVGKLLQDYISLYRKEVAKERTRQKSEKKDKRSKSKGPSQPEKRGKAQEKDQGPWKSVLQRLEKSQNWSSKELLQLRTKLIELEQTLELYRSRQRRHLLSGGDFYS